MKNTPIKNSLLTVISMAALASSSQAAILVTTTKTVGDGDGGVPVPTVSNTDLAQTVGITLNVPVSGDALAARAGELFNGNIGIEGGNAAAAGQVRMDSNDVLEVTFDTTANTFGYDITGIDTYFGWNPDSGGRSDQGYSIELSYVGSLDWVGFVAGQHWEDNDPAEYWTTVSFAEDGGGILNSATVNLDGAGAVAEATANIASGIDGIRFTFQNLNNPTVGREIDIFGTATVPEPSAFALLAGGLALGSVMLRRRRG